MNLEQLCAAAAAAKPSPERFTPVPNKVYQATITGYTPDIPGEFGPSTAVSLTLEDKGDVTMWLSGLQDEQFLAHMRDAQLPALVNFARVPKESKAGRIYNTLVIADVV